VKFGVLRSLKIRDARLEDSKILSDLQWEYLQRYSALDTPKSAENYRLAIGNSVLRGNRFTVAEDDTAEVIGFIEQKKQNTSVMKLGFPYVSLNHPKRKDVQFHLMNQTIEKVRESGYRFVTIEFSSSMDRASQLFSSLGFGDEKVIFQSWEGEILPKIDAEMDPFDLRRVKLKDLDITYSWIASQLDHSSPLYISKSTYRDLLIGPKGIRDGWALATLDERPVGMITSIQDNQTNSVIIFGPYCEDGFEKIRIPITNELLLYYRLRGYTHARILRTKPFQNDAKLFKTFGFAKIDEIRQMSKEL
jgi:hypothetical protein